MRAFDVAAKSDWAIETRTSDTGEITAPALKQILDIASRQHEPDIQAVAQKLADKTDGAGIVEMRGSVAVVNVNGPIFRYANLFTMISGATSIEELATAFRAAVDDHKVSAIVLNIDSPGGEVAGVSELANAIYDARGAKPIVAYADDLAASGAYWLASAASSIVASDTAMLGSIGVVGTIIERAPKDGTKTYQFVSSVSPNKRPDLETEDGRSQVQQRIDDLASVFVSAVARNRGVPEQKVLQDFGRGGVLIASKAVAAGMADSIGTFEGLVSALAEQTSGMFVGGVPAMKGVVRMDKPNTPAEQKPADPAITAADVSKAKAEGVTEGRAAERKRIGAILTSKEAEGREQLARTFALETETDPETVAKLLAAAPVAAAAKPAENPLAAAMAKVANPNVGNGAAGEADDEKNLVAGILQFVPAHAKGGK